MDVEKRTGLCYDEDKNLQLMALAGRPCPSGRPVRGITLEQREYEIEADIAADTIGYTYRKLLRVDLVRDRCEVLKSSPDGWQPGDGDRKSVV